MSLLCLKEQLDGVLQYREYISKQVGETLKLTRTD
jgi:hypothetical protein